MDIPQTLYDELSEASASIVAPVHEKAVEWTDSPIEALFLTSFSLVCRLRGDQHAVLLNGAQPKLNRSANVRWFIAPQFEIGEFRCDFLVGRYYEHHDASLIVECDGHEFHDRTKEQASKDRRRDRWLQSQGYKVFRFTGSDLYQRPIRCAAEVVIALTDESKTTSAPKGSS